MRERLSPPKPEKWVKDAACKDHPFISTEQFFFDPPRRASRSPKETNLLYEQARQVCLDECPVRRECLIDALYWEHSLAGSARYGLFGGLDPAQRAAVAKNRSALVLEGEVNDE